VTKGKKQKKSMREGGNPRKSAVAGRKIKKKNVTKRHERKKGGQSRQRGGEGVEKIGVKRSYQGGKGKKKEGTRKEKRFTRKEKVRARGGKEKK